MCAQHGRTLNVVRLRKSNLKLNYFQYLFQIMSCLLYDQSSVNDTINMYK